MELIHNEHTKPLATYLNGIAFGRARSLAIVGRVGRSEIGGQRLK